MTESNAQPATSGAGLLSDPLAFGLDRGGWIQEAKAPSCRAASGPNCRSGRDTTLLGLIIGFTFSMALTRYDQRKNYEEEEANAIGTEYVRADLLPQAEATRVRELLVSYLEQRILFYTTRDGQELEQINARTAELQTDLWSSVRVSATAQPTLSRYRSMAGGLTSLAIAPRCTAARFNRASRGIRSAAPE